MLASGDVVLFASAELLDVRVFVRLLTMAAAGNAVAAIETASIAVRAFFDSFIMK